MLCDAQVSFGSKPIPALAFCLKTKKTIILTMMAVNVEHAAVATGQGTDVQPVLHGSAAVAPPIGGTTAAPGTLTSPSPGATAANRRVRSNSRTPDRGRTPDRERAASHGAFHIVALSPPTIGGVEAAKKRRATSQAPTSPSAPPPRSLPFDLGATPRGPAGDAGQMPAGAARPGAVDSIDMLAATIRQLQQQVDEMNREKIRFETNMLKRLDDTRTSPSNRPRSLSTHRAGTSSPALRRSL